MNAEVGHTDYSSMIKATKKPFIDTYEEIMLGYESEYNMSDELTTSLHEKRAFGLKKYGEDSFQASFENAMSTPIIIHLKEEIIDALNYSLHLRFVSALRNPKDIQQIDAIVENLRRILSATDDLTGNGNNGNSVSS